jgi:hypothetical protein
VAREAPLFGNGWGWLGASMICRTCRAVSCATSVLTGSLSTCRPQRNMGWACVCDLPVN